MSGIVIVTDTSALFSSGTDLTRVIRVPIAVALDGEAYTSEDPDDFYEQMENGARATTSQPSPGDFLAAYELARVSGAEDVLSIHLDARISGTVASAELAAREASIPVTVVDTRTVSFGVGKCVEGAAKALEAGASVFEAGTLARRLGSTLRNVFVAPGAPAGRIAEVEGWAVLEFVDGVSNPIASRSTPEQAIDVMCESIGGVEPIRAGVGHAAVAVESAADALASRLAASEKVIEVERYRVGQAVGAHTGPLSFGAFWWPAE